MWLVCICRFVLYFVLVLVPQCFGDEYNLYGEAGQAYAIEINVGHPHQKLKVLVDTGSSTLAIAANAMQDVDIYFHSKNSTSIVDTGKEVQAKYYEGNWVGRLVSDFVHFPTLPSVPEIRSDIALITRSHNFFVNGSGWQGLLGLAYLPISAWGENVIVESWLESLDRTLHKKTSFELKLCGPLSSYNDVHTGYFRTLINEQSTNNNQSFRTTILRQRWYEIGVISVRVLSNNTNTSKDVQKETIADEVKNEEYFNSINQAMCKKLNEEKSILDSGTTNIRLPDELYLQVARELRNELKSSNSNLFVMDEFWYHGETACWPEPKDWTAWLPWLAIDLLNDDDDKQYFTLELPPQNYMRLLSANNKSDETGKVSEFCYKLGLEAGGKETVLGYSVMEGFEIVFNRSAGWISFQTSDCGPGTRISGPYNFSRSLIRHCQLTRPLIETAISIQAAQWALCVISIIAGIVLVYILAPCVKMLLMKKNMPSSPQISLSQAALVEQRDAT